MRANTTSTFFDTKTTQQIEHFFLRNLNIQHTPSLLMNDKPGFEIPPPTVPIHKCWYFGKTVSPWKDSNWSVASVPVHSHQTTASELGNRLRPSIFYRTANCKTSTRNIIESHLRLSGAHVVHQGVPSWTQSHCKPERKKGERELVHARDQIQAYKYLILHDNPAVIVTVVLCHFFESVRLHFGRKGSPNRLVS